MKDKKIKKGPGRPRNPFPRQVYVVNEWPYVATNPDNLRLKNGGQAGVYVLKSIKKMKITKELV